MPRKSKGFSIRKPRLRISSKGIGISAPSARIGRKSGLNISKSGVSGSFRTKAGTVNTKKGCSRKLPFMILPLVIVFLALKFK